MITPDAVLNCLKIKEMEAYIDNELKNGNFKIRLYQPEGGLYRSLFDSMVGKYVSAGWNVQVFYDYEFPNCCGYIDLDNTYLIFDDPRMESE